jgi:predicted XRE-type DNA-binding protein
MVLTELDMVPKVEASDETKLKVELATKLNDLIAQCGMSQSQAAAKIGTSQSKVSQISRYRLANVSVGRLLQALVALEQRIDILIRPTEEHARPGVRVAA